MSELLELLPILGGGIFGAVVKLWTNAQHDKAEERKYNIMAHAKNVEAFTTNNQFAQGNAGFSWTRRFIVVCIMSIVVGAFWMNGTIQVPTEIKQGGSYLFGLIDTTTINTVFVELKGYVVLPVVILISKALIGTYFGASIATRK